MKSCSGAVPEETPTTRGCIPERRRGDVRAAQFVKRNLVRARTADGPEGWHCGEVIVSCRRCSWGTALKETRMRERESAMSRQVISEEKQDLLTVLCLGW